MNLFNGCSTALITPLNDNFQVSSPGLQKLVDFQIKEGVKGILAVGTTGESPTLNWKQHNMVIEKVYEFAHNRVLTIAGTGSNSTHEAIVATEHAQDIGVEAILLVDPYYNGPSSLEIRKEYIEPIATRFQNIQIIPYIIPGRTGTQLLPQDLAVLHSEFKNVQIVKEATGDYTNMELTRKLCGENFNILSGDDDKTFNMMSNPKITASGVISVASNIVPNAVQRMVQFMSDGNIQEASKLNEILKPLFSLITVITEESTPFGPVKCKARNPLPYKTLMNILGMPAGPCKQPLGKLTKKGLDIVLLNTRQLYENNPDILRPVEDTFSVDLSERLYNEEFWQGLYYD